MKKFQVSALVAAILASPKFLLAQQALSEVANTVESEIKAVFTPTIVIINIVVVLIIVAVYFAGESRDVRKGLIALVLLVVADLIAVAIINFSSTLTV